MKDVIIIGAGLTGLTTSFLLKRQGKSILLLEKDDKTGGAIQSHIKDGYVFEEGPNTGVVSNPEVAELFELLNCEFETANESAERRLILKNDIWHPLPNGAFSFMKTPLFSASDKIKIVFEPLRRKGTDPEESISSLASRRIGQSFVDYAVNPFISGIYAGDPDQLITKYALPKLYNLEQDYGSFIGGAVKKSREKKSERDKKASRKVFSVKGGLGSLTLALESNIGAENILSDINNITVRPCKDYFEVSYTIKGVEQKVETKNVISTIGAFALPELLPFVSEQDMNTISNLNYAKIIQVAVALKEKALNPRYISFGGLIPKKENRNLLGVLFPSYCFDNRTPEECSILAIYIGGIRRPDLYNLTDKEIEEMVRFELNDLFEINPSTIRFMEVFRHPHAIPQYEKTSGARFETIKKLEEKHKGLIIAGNLRDGIGMADRIRQAFTIAEKLK